MGLKSTLAGLLMAAPLALAHPGHHEKIQANAAQPLDRRNLNHCSKRFADEEFVKRTVERHGNEFLRLRRNLGVEAADSPPIQKRNYITVSQVDHHADKDVSFDMDPATLFADAGACMLMPAVDQGPLYVAGEEVRKDITEGEAGIKMTVAIQVVDVKTCEPVPDAYVDIWSSNSTGIYMGVMGYPNMGDPNDTGMLKGTAMRGVQPTDDHGIATFDTLMPGHYDGRTTHIHAIVYLGATKNANNTISGGRAAHIGQIYFDQSMLAEVEKVTPYNTNTMTVLPNVRDALFMMGANGDDPIVRYSLVGDNIADGIFSWIRFGINTGANKPVSPAAWWTEEGGVMNPNGPVAQMNRGGFGGGGFGGGGFGGMFGRKKAREAEQAEQAEQAEEEQ